MKKLFLNYKFPRSNLFYERYDQIYNEYKEAESNIEFKDFTNEQNSYISECEKGYPITEQAYFSAKTRIAGTNGWHIAAISVNGVFYPRNAIHLPILVDTVKEISDICACGINILDPDTKLDWHSDAEYSKNRKSFRCLWVLDGPEKDCFIHLRDNKTGNVESKLFEKNQIYSFFHSTTHKVENLSDQPRVALAFDVSMSSSFSYDW